MHTGGPGRTSGKALPTQSASNSTGITQLASSFNGLAASLLLGGEDALPLVWQGQITNRTWRHTAQNLCI